MEHDEFGILRISTLVYKSSTMSSSISHKGLARSGSGLVEKLQTMRVRGAIFFFIVL